MQILDNFYISNNNITKKASKDLLESLPAYLMIKPKLTFRA